MGCRSNHMHFINVVYGCPSVAHISLVVTCHHGPDLLTVNMSQYIQLKSTRVQSASPEPGDLDAATESFLLTSTKFPEYTSSSVTSRSSMMSFPLGMFLSCCCRLPPNMKPKSPKKLEKEERVRG